MEKELGLSDELPKAHDGEIVIDNIKEGKKEKEEKKEALAAWKKFIFFFIYLI